MSMQKELDELREKLGDPLTRMNSLYWVQDEKGGSSLFRMRPAQQMFWDEMWYLNVILKARQLGFSTEVALYFLDTCIFYENTAAGIVDYTLKDAKAKLAKILYAYERMPEAIRKLVPLKKESVEELEWANGSSIKVGTSHRGGTLQLLHISEYGKIAAEAPDRAKEIKTGSFGTVHKGQQITVESTAEGIGGEFYELVQRSQANMLSEKELTPLDFRFHFFPWWQHKDYRLSASVALRPDEIEYFEKLEAKHGIVTDQSQRIWYVKKLEQMNGNLPDMYKEYPSIPEEAFFASLEGAYFRRQMLKMRQSGRLGDVPHDPSRPVNTFWDIGKTDATAIWFHQTDGVRHRMIHYLEDTGEDVSYYAKELDRLALPETKGGRGFRYGKHYGPHDLDHTSWLLPGNKKIKDVAKENGITFVVVPKIQNKQDSINAARGMLNMTWVDETHCDRGVQCLDSYTKQWDPQLGVFKKTPVANWAGHGADAYQCGACGINPRTVPGAETPKRHRARMPASRPPWAS